MNLQKQSTEIMNKILKIKLCTDSAFPVSFGFIFISKTSMWYAVHICISYRKMVKDIVEGDVLCLFKLYGEQHQHFNIC